MMTESRYQEIALSIAWWNELPAESRTTILRSLTDRGLEATVEEAWNQFGKGIRRNGWRPQRESLTKAIEIVSTG